MGFFKELEIEVMDRMNEGMTDAQIATDLKLPLDEVRRIMAAFYGMDYDVADTDASPDIDYDSDFLAEHY
jgi:transcription initiation factor IIE alpha subunit